MNYTTPKLCKSKSGWYVYLRYNGKQYRYKCDINRIKNLKEREKEAKVLITILKEKLRNGWTPENRQIEVEMPTIINALEFALSKKKVSPKTLSGYKTTLKFVIEAIKKMSMQYLLIDKTKRSDIKKILEKAMELNSWTNKSYNKHLGHLGAILSELYDWDMIEVNPAHNIRKLPVCETVANRTATEEEHIKIKKELSTNHPNFYKFVLIIFHTGIRISETLKLQLSMISLEERVIVMPPTITKNKKQRIVPINNHLMEHLLDMELNIYPKDFYLFGSYRPKGKGNVGKYIDFIPAPTKIKYDTASRRWKRIVKDGLGIDVNLYSNKHAGADAKILAGIELDVLRELYGHQSKQMTEKYARAVKDVYRNEIIDKSPEF